MKPHSNRRLGALLVLVAALGAGEAAAGVGDGEVLGVTKIVDHGPAVERYNLVIVAEGYQIGEQAAFASDAQGYSDYLLATPPFDGVADAFNVWRLDVASDESGADDPVACGGTGAQVATYFDASFCHSGIRRLLTVDNALVMSAVGAQVAEWDQILVIVNSTIYGGSGGIVAVISLGGSWEEVALHEFGHSGFGLADEYAYWLGCGLDTDRDHYPNGEPAEANVTIETDLELLKWGGLVEAGTPIPTTLNADCADCDTQGNPYPGQTVVGLYEGARYYHCDIFRPAFHCKMRSLAQPFCPVCAARITAVLRPFRPFGPAVPSMSIWTMALLVALLPGGACWRLRRKPPPG